MLPASGKRAFLLVVDDDPAARLTLAMFLKRMGYQVDEARETKEAVQKLGQKPYDIVITDLRMEGEGGIGVLNAAKKVSSSPEVILLTAYGNISSAVEAIKRGAFDYLEKPFEPNEMLLKIQKALDQRRLKQEKPSRQGPIRQRGDVDAVVVKSPKMQAVLETAFQAAQSDATVLIQGESGTGKELIARAIHTWSPRAACPFITIDCGTLPETLLESELFGHVRGAFTGALVTKKGLFEEGDGGTIFLDEVEMMPPSIQMKLLRVLQAQVIRRVGSTTPTQINIRILAATNQDLKSLLAKGILREDLYYRLKGIVLTIPPLRQRTEEVIALADHFVKRFSQRLGRKVQGVSPEAMELLLRYPWPGNVRELEKTIERAVVLGRSDFILPEDLPSEFLDQADNPTLSPTKGRITLAEREKAQILAVLYLYDWNQTKAAEELGINRSTLWRKMRDYHIENLP